MKFITKEEIEYLIKGNILDDVTQDNNKLLDSIELMALSEVDSYIGHKYNIKEVFARTGDSRNQFFMGLITDLMLYHLHSRLTPSEIPIIRQERYDKQISYLFEVSRGKITPNIPLNEIPFETRSSESRFGTQPKVNNLTY